MGSIAAVVAVHIAGEDTRIYRTGHCLAGSEKGIPVIRVKAPVNGYACFEHKSVVRIVFGNGLDSGCFTVGDIRTCRHIDLVTGR